MQNSITNRIKSFLIITLSVLMMMPNTVAAFAKEGTDEKKIEKLFTLANKLDPVATGKTNEDGQVTFANLPDGMYLVAETKAEGEASKYELAKPFLVSLPLYTNGEWKHNVTISPKSEVKKIPNEKPVVPPSEKPKEKPKADTGISTNSSILMLLAVLLTASAGACMISQKEEEAC